MSENNPSALSPFAAQLQALIDRRGYDETRAAGLLGVPVHTLRKWIKGERKPSASALRLLEVLGLLEAIAPALFASLEPPAPAAPVVTQGETEIKTD